MNTRWPLCLLPCTALILLIILLIHAPAPASGQETGPGLPDLDVTFINRAQMYHAYCVDYPWDLPGMPGMPYLCPGTEGERRWPEPGEIVTFTAHVINKGALASAATDFTWFIDGAPVLTGTLPALAPAAEATAVYTWTWAHGLEGERLTGVHTVGFAADPLHQVSEMCETNNLLTDRTDAFSFQIAITPEMYAIYNEPISPDLPRSAEDWLQKQIPP